ncbi:hypothetical protein, partial [Candidatus Binatus sp.]|uniref:hypothetical protein n=1 Tax=Candidatus Binatus sp. TaxID=2811406 RepID=UPI00272D22EB
LHDKGCIAWPREADDPDSRLSRLRELKGRCVLEDPQLTRATHVGRKSNGLVAMRPDLGTRVLKGDFGFARPNATSAEARNSDGDRHANAGRRRH